MEKVWILWLPNRKEHKFLRNVYIPKVLKMSKNLSTLIKYYSAFRKFVKLLILLENSYIKYSDFDQISEETDLEKFFCTFCPDCENFEDLFNETDWIEVKNSFKKKKKKKKKNNRQKTTQDNGFSLQQNYVVSRRWFYYSKHCSEKVFWKCP